MNVPENLKYTKDHEWVKVDGNIATIGITDFAQSELGDIVFVDINSEGEDLSAQDIFGTVEAVKTVSDLYMPIAGKVIEINPSIDSSPELINSDAYGEGWMVKVEMSNAAEIEGLMSAAEYQDLVG